MPFYGLGQVTYKPDPDAPSPYAGMIPGTTDQDWQNFHQKKSIEAAMASVTSEAVEDEIVRLQARSMANMQTLVDSTPPINAAGIVPDYADVIAPNPAQQMQPTAQIDPNRNLSNYQAGRDAALPSEAAVQKQPMQAVNGNAQNRVNADTAQTGARAVVDPLTGQVTLTNLDEAGNRMPSGIITKTSVQAMPNGLAPSLQAGLDGLKNAATFDDAIGQVGSIRATLAEQRAKLEKDALTFAEQKVGVPTLQTQLMQAEAADRASPSWFPGIGDSPTTAQVRQRLAAAQTAVGPMAERFLSTNSAATQLAVTSKQVDMIMAQKNKILTAKEQLEMRGDQKAQDKEEQYAATGMGLDPTVRDRMIAINPNLLKNGDVDANIGRTFLQVMKGDKNAKAALEAPESALPVLALAGNGTAEKILIGKQMAYDSSVTEGQVKEQFAKIRNLVVSKDFEKMATEAMDPKAAKEWIQERKVAKMGGGEKSKEQLQKDYALAWSIRTRARTESMMTDVSGWNIPELKESVMAAQKMTRTAKLDDVLTAYLGGSTGKEAIEKVNKFQGFADQAVAGKKGSIFGMPDATAVKAAILNSARSKSILGENPIKEFISRQIDKGMTGPNALLNIVPDTMQLMGIDPNFKMPSADVSQLERNAQPKNILE